MKPAVRTGMLTAAILLLLALSPASASMKGIATGTQIGSPASCGASCIILTLDDPFAIANNNPAYIRCVGAYAANCASVLVNEHVVVSYHECPILTSDGIVHYDLVFDGDKFNHSCPAGSSCG